MPWTYRHADKEFRAFLTDARDRMDLSSDNMTYTAVDGVFRVFRARLTPAQGLAFADLLPAILRAMLVQQWDISQPPRPFAPRADLLREVQALRRHHNLTPDNAIEATAWALRRCLRQADLDRLLQTLPDGAVDYWHVSVDDPSELDQRII